MTLLVTNPLVVAVGASVAANTLPEFLSYAKAGAGGINYGSPGVMSLPHLATEFLAKQAGLNVEQRNGPWLLSVNPFDPHAPFDAPPEGLPPTDSAVPRGSATAPRASP